MTKEQSERYSDPRWLDKSLEIKNLDDHTCQHCGITHKKVHKLTAHHLFYLEPNRPPWETPNHGMVTVCEPCHWQEQKLYYKRDNKEKQAAWFATLTTMMLKIFGQWMQDSLTKILQRRILYALQFVFFKNRKPGARMTKIVTDKILHALVPEDQWAEFITYCRAREGGTNYVLDFNSNGHSNGHSNGNGKEAITMLKLSDLLGNGKENHT